MPRWPHSGDRQDGRNDQRVSGRRNPRDTPSALSYLRPGRVVHSRWKVSKIFELDADERMVARIAFGLDEFDAALAELDARYLAGEAAAHAQTWSVVAGAYAALNRHELPATTPDWVNVDHRRGATFAPGELIEYLRAGWLPRSRNSMSSTSRPCIG